MTTPPPPYQPPQQPGQGQPQVPPPPPAYSQGGQPWGYQAPGAPQGQSGQSPKGFFAALFDWRFQTLITPQIVSWVYLVGMVLIGLYWLGFVVVGFATEPVIGILALVIGPVFVIISLALFRMTLEFYFALVRMSDDIHRGEGTVRR